MWSLLEDLSIAIVGVALDFHHYRVTSFELMAEK
jgi:hypothetical protein